MIKLGKKFQKMIPLYEMFAKEFASDNIDFSDKAKEDMYRYETYGEGFVDERNGYFLGKKILYFTSNILERRYEKWAIIFF